MRKGLVFFAYFCRISMRASRVARHDRLCSGADVRRRDNLSAGRRIRPAVIGGGGCSGRPGQWRVALLPGAVCRPGRGVLARTGGGARRRGGWLCAKRHAHRADGGGYRCQGGRACQRALGRPVPSDVQDCTGTERSLRNGEERSQAPAPLPRPGGIDGNGVSRRIAGRTRRRAGRAGRDDRGGGRHADRPCAPRAGAVERAAQPGAAAGGQLGRTLYPAGDGQRRRPQADGGRGGVAVVWLLRRRPDRGDLRLRPERAGRVERRFCADAWCGHSPRAR